MNITEADILQILLCKSCSSQRELAALSGHSLGAVNGAVRGLSEQGFLENHLKPSQNAVLLGRKMSPRRAVILAAGSGRRMTPIHLSTPKAFLEVSGEPLIERLICQLHEAGIHEIYIVVGFMKEKFEYLMDKYQVELIVNPDYEDKNNLHSVQMALPFLSDAYVLPADIWCRSNPFRKCELYSWYMVTDERSGDSMVRVNRKSELVKAEGGNAMIGICYLTEERAAGLKKRIVSMCHSREYDRSFWEEALFYNHKMEVSARVVSACDYIELNTYEQLRNLDSNSRQLQSGVLSAAARVLNARTEELCGISAVKEGITNRSFRFSCKNREYIMRIPQHNIREFTDRQREAEVYQAIAPFEISDKVLYINSTTGWKLAEFLEGARPCNPNSSEDVDRCMIFLRKFHELGLTVPHTVDLYERILYFENLRNGPSAYGDYERTREKVFSLLPFIEAHRGKYVLTHMDAVPENFLFYRNDQEKEQIRLIDWECSAMQDPHVDLAMFCVYALYRRKQVDSLIDAYFPEGCKRDIRIKIYCYISVCGLMWSNWCEYKQKIGVRFGEYSLRQYRFAKDYYRIAMEEIEKGNEND